jgi:hypothetical protein
MKITEDMMTPWFPADVNPAYPGVYELNSADQDGRCFSYWNGKFFEFTAWEWVKGDGAAGAVERCYDEIGKRGPTNFAGNGWRALNFDPKKSAK